MPGQNDQPHRDADADRAPPPLYATRLDVRPPLHFLRSAIRLIGIPFVIITMIPVLHLATSIGTRGLPPIGTSFSFYALPVIASVVGVFAMRKRAERSSHECTEATKRALRNVPHKHLPHLVHLAPAKPPNGIRRNLYWTPYEQLPEAPPNFEEVALQHDTNDQGQPTGVMLPLAIAGYMAFHMWPLTTTEIVQIVIVVGVFTAIRHLLRSTSRRANRLLPIVDPEALEIRLVVGTARRYPWRSTRLVVAGHANNVTRLYVIDAGNTLPTETLDIPVTTLPTLLGALHAATILRDQESTP